MDPEVRWQRPWHETTDSVLALGWLYSDLVHVELRKDRAVAAELPMSQRYLAASPVPAGSLGRRGDIPFLDESGGEVDRHEGAVIDLDIDGDARTLTVLVGNSVAPTSMSRPVRTARRQALPR